MMKFRFNLLIFCSILFMITNCTTKQKQALPFNEPPEWSQEAIWYQIFVERFRNGSKSNDPTLNNIQEALIDVFPNEWAPTPWGHNWYNQEDWAKSSGLDFYRTIQMRRYGGDLLGVKEKIPYLVDLGITAIYFNPINNAPSLHKYDASHYHHIDIHFGPDPEGDKKLIEQEDPADPKTWVWTSADLLFLDIVKELHAAGIKVVVDFSWNHTGNQFWAFKDIQKNLENSKFKDWYSGISFNKDADSNIVSFDYDGWYGIKSLPELKKINTEGKIAGHPYEGNMQEEVKNHIFEVSRRWMDPNGDGNCEDGIDGIRLDVAEHVPLGFWRDYRKFVRGVNPDFYLVGENWWTDWPDVLMDPKPWLEGDVFDAVMHYQWFKLARGYFSEPIDKVNLKYFKSGLDSIFLKHPGYTQRALMNLASSHDSPRLLTSFFNINKYKHRCKPSEDDQYRTNKPGQITYHQTKLFLLHQFTFVGAPHIWNGDEMGMYGADDPDNRKPLLWPDIEFETETQSDYSKYSYAEKPVFDKEMFDYLKSLIKLRKTFPVLNAANYAFIDFDQDSELLAYSRSNDKQMISVFINNSQNEMSIPIDNTSDEIIFSYNTESALNKNILPPYSGLVLKRNKLN